MLMRCQHLALLSSDLGRTRAFYADLLGLDIATFSPQEGMLALRLEEGFILRFHRTEEPFSSASVAYLGLELSSFKAVDELLEQLSKAIPIERNVRERFRRDTGPYGFFIRDPDGYRIKVFSHNYGE